MKRRAVDAAVERWLPPHAVRRNFVSLICRSSFRDDTKRSGNAAYSKKCIRRSLERVDKLHIGWPHPDRFDSYPITQYRSSASATQATMRHGLRQCLDSVRRPATQCRSSRIYIGSITSRQATDAQVHSVGLPNRFACGRCGWPAVWTGLPVDRYRRGARAGVASPHLDPAVIIGGIGRHSVWREITQRSDAPADVRSECVRAGEGPSAGRPADQSVASSTPELVSCRRVDRRSRWRTVARRRRCVRGQGPLPVSLAEAGLAALLTRRDASMWIV
jgi:hypothetical protein